MKNVECSELRLCFCFYALSPLLQAIFDWAVLSNQVKLMHGDLVVRASSTAAIHFSGLFSTIDSPLPTGSTASADHSLFIHLLSTQY